MTIGQQMTYRHHPNISAIESRIVERLIDDLLAAGLHLRVWEGEDFAPETPRPITDKDAIWKALASTDADTLFVYQPAWQEGGGGCPLARIGWVALVWGNDQHVISDYTVNLAGEGDREGQPDLIVGAMRLVDEIERGAV